MPEKIEPQLDEIRRRARRRLVGAVVLALAAAVLVPMLLESDPKPLGEDVAVKIPPVDEGKFVSKLGEKSRSADAPPTPIKPAPATKPGEVSSAAPAKETVTAPKAAVVEAAPPPAKPTIVPPLSSPPAKESAPPAEASTSSTPAPPSKPAAPAPSTAAPPAPEATKTAKPASGAFSVQLAAFSDDKGANALVNRLKKSGHPAYTEPYSSTRGTVWRVRVGPFGTREAAEGARSRLKADGQDGIIATSN